MLIFNFYIRHIEITFLYMFNIHIIEDAPRKSLLLNTRLQF